MAAHPQPQGGRQLLDIVSSELSTANIPFSQLMEMGLTAWSILAMQVLERIGQGNGAGLVG